jgi:putative ABC transport system permease protein
LETIGRRLAQAYPGTNQNILPVVRGFDEWFVGTAARTLYAGLWGAVACVLLIVCVNVANLLILQAVGRSDEIAVRLALGAGRWRLLRQFVIERLLLSTIGGVIGWWVATRAVRMYMLARVESGVLAIEIDWTVIAYLTGVSLITALAAGMATATYLMRVSAWGVSRRANRTVAGSRGESRFLYMFVTVQMALAVVLLAGAGGTICRCVSRPRTSASKLPTSLPPLCTCRLSATPPSKRDSPCFAISARDSRHFPVWTP